MILKSVPDEIANEIDIVAGLLNFPNMKNLLKGPNPQPPRL